MAELQVLNPQDVRKENTIEIPIGDGKMVIARKLDMTTIVFEGVVPMTMLTAVQRMIDMPSGTSAVERVAALGGEGKNMVELLRKHAVMVVIAPKLSVEEIDAPNVLPVSYLDIGQLMAIWTATAVVPHFGASQAARFRRDAGIDDAPAAPTGDGVQPETELVADPPVEPVTH